MKLRINTCPGGNHGGMKLYAADLVSGRNLES